MEQSIRNPGGRKVLKPVGEHEGRWDRAEHRGRVNEKNEESVIGINDVGEHEGKWGMWRTSCERSRVDVKKSRASREGE